MPTHKHLVVAVLSLLTASLPARAADSAAGSVAMGNATGSISHAVMVRGPDEMDPARQILRLYLSSSDIRAQVEACKDLACADAALQDGAMVDFGDARHLGYAVRLDGERVQYSGGTDAGAFALTTHTPDHLAGKLHIDDSGMGGARVDATFDLTVARTFTSVR